MWSRVLEIRVLPYQLSVTKTLLKRGFYMIDNEVRDILWAERMRQQDTIELIASEISLRSTVRLYITMIIIFCIKNF